MVCLFQVKVLEKMLNMRPIPVFGEKVQIAFVWKILKNEPFDPVFELNLQGFIYLQIQHFPLDTAVVEKNY